MRAGITLALLTLLPVPTLEAQVRSGELLAQLSAIRRAIGEWTPDARLTGPNKAIPQSMERRERERQLRARARDALESLVDRLDAASSADVSPEYVRSFRDLAAIAQTASFESMEDVASDLEAKVEHSRAFGPGTGGSVVLKVNTLGDAGPVSQLQVVYLLKIYERVALALPTTFPRLSTPTEAIVQPGRYLIWARNPSTGDESDSMLVRAAGQKELLVDLPVP